MNTKIPNFEHTQRTLIVRSPGAAITNHSGATRNLPTTRQVTYMVSNRMVHAWSPGHLSRGRSCRAPGLKLPLTGTPTWSTIDLDTINFH